MTVDPLHVHGAGRQRHAGRDGRLRMGAQQLFESSRTSRSLPVGARVTLTSGSMDVKRIYRHLTRGDGVLGSRLRAGHDITEPWACNCRCRLRRDARQFRDLAYDFLEASVAGRHHGFSNIKETLEELHKGVSKAYPCGAGLGLLGVATDGDVALCHRFAAPTRTGSGRCTTASTARRNGRFWSSITLRTRPTATSAGRGRCARAAAIMRRTRATARPRGQNLHYCNWIRGWTDVCLRILR